MVSSCCAFGCTYRYKKGDNISFFRFPKNSTLLALWVKAIRRENWIPTLGSRLCGKHFQSGKPSSDENHPDYVPNVFIYNNPRSTLQSFERRRKVVEKRSNLEKREESEEVIQAASALCLLNSPDSGPRNAQSEKDSLIEKLYLEVNSLREEKQKLQDKLNSQDLFQDIMHDPKKISFYTGLLSYDMFKIILESVVQDSVKYTKTKLSAEVQLLITLMKLKLNLLNSDLGYRFKVSKRTIQRILDEWIPALADKLEELIRWPSQRALKKNLPVAFQNSLYKNTVCIIDCTEVPIERPATQIARSQTWSNYKHKQTVKYLVACSPTGHICFVSAGWGGRTSDKELTINCGIIEKLNPGDVVLADRGFSVEDVFASRGAKLIVPTFTRGRKQLSKHEILHSKKVSNVRIHVERVIRQIKRFRILQSTIPIKCLKYIDNVWIICAALSNLSPSIVK